MKPILLQPHHNLARASRIVQICMQSRQQRQRLHIHPHPTRIKLSERRGRHLIVRREQRRPQHTVIKLERRRQSVHSSAPSAIFRRVSPARISDRLLVDEERSVVARERRPPQNRHQPLAHARLGDTEAVRQREIVQGRHQLHVDGGDGRVEAGGDQLGRRRRLERPQMRDDREHARAAPLGDGVERGRACDGGEERGGRPAETAVDEAGERFRGRVGGEGAGGGEGGRGGGGGGVGGGGCDDAGEEVRVGDEGAARGEEDTQLRVQFRGAGDVGVGVQGRIQRCVAQTARSGGDAQAAAGLLSAAKSAPAACARARGSARRPRRANGDLLKL